MEQDVGDEDSDDYSSGSAYLIDESEGESESSGAAETGEVDGDDWDS